MRAWVAIGAIERSRCLYAESAKAFEHALLLARKTGDERVANMTVFQLVNLLVWGPTPVVEALRRIEGADPVCEIGGVTEVAAGLPECPALLFDAIKGHARGFRVFTNATVSPQRAALSRSQACAQARYFGSKSSGLSSGAPK